jgi:[acyl-carrier-protein] S-malonyltransferase
MVDYTAFYPGQGAQYPGMAVDLHAASAQVRQLFSIASEACGRNLLQLLESGTAEDLQLTENTQVVITLANRAASIYLAHAGIKAHTHAGFSLGELSALAGAGVLDDESLFHIVAERGKLMARSGESASKRIGRLGMAAVIGLGFDAVQAIFTTLGTTGLYCANDNGPKQVVLSGLADELEAVTEALKAAGARRIIPLKVSGPFHTPFMAEAAVEFSEFIQRFSFADPVSVVYSTVTGFVIPSGSEAKRLCALQLESPVRWTTIMQRIAGTLEEGSRVLEVGPGKVLAGLWKSAGHTALCYPAGTAEDLKLVIEGEGQHGNGT